MDGGFPQPEHAIRYFAVIGAKEDTDAPAEAGQVLPVSILQRYPKEDSPDARFPPALASFCFPRGGAKVVPAEEETFDALHGFVLTNEAGTRCFGAALHLWCTHSSGLLVQKALAVVSKQPLWGARAQASSEGYIVNFVAETPLPPPGFVVSVALPQLPELALHRPAPNQLPLLDLPVRRMIQQLKPETMASVAPVPRHVPPPKPMPRPAVASVASVAPKPPSSLPEALQVIQAKGPPAPRPAGPVNAFTVTAMDFLCGFDWAGAMLGLTRQDAGLDVFFGFQGCLGTFRGDA
eukprot:g20706.t1